MAFSAAYNCGADYSKIKTDEGSRAYNFYGCLASHDGINLNLNLANSSSSSSSSSNNSNASAIVPPLHLDGVGATWPAGYAIGVLMSVTIAVALFDAVYSSILPSWRGLKMASTKTAVLLRVTSYDMFFNYGVSFVIVGAMPPPGVPEMQAVEYLVIGIFNVVVIVLMWLTKEYLHGIAARYATTPAHHLLRCFVNSRTLMGCADFPLVLSVRYQATSFMLTCGH